ncbi:MAG TPA: glutamate racemase [Acidiferrobacterales bacterium]|nr:glutamate racemase [Acidiferrobacterales bacterium]
MSSRPEFPIGVFDSGIGGLTVARALMQRLPYEQILYFGDTARVPYGVKSADTISLYATQITDFLLEQRVKLLVVACNTMAAVAAAAIRARSSVPVLDVIETGAQVAVQCTRNRRIGVIGTLTTIGSGAYDTAIHAHKPDIAIHSQACPLFVPLVEEGWLDHPVTLLTAREYLGPILAQDIDTLVLGCTHYPLLQPLLHGVVGSTVQLVDSAAATAAQAEVLLARLALLNPGNTTPVHRYYVTDVPQRFRVVGERFLGQPLADVQVMKW